MAVIMLASLTVLLVASAAFMVYDLVTFRRAMLRNLITQARMIAENSTAAVMFRNENDAANVLASLRADPHLIAAAIYDANGRLFVKYPAQFPAADLPATPKKTGFHFGKSDLTLFQPVVQSGKELGTLYLRSDLTAVWQRLQLYAVISLMIMLGSLLVAFWLSHLLQRRISNPITVLAQTARKISEQHNYSLRAPKLSDDELGLLTDSFNTMLDRIQASDSALRASEAQFRLVTDQAPVLLAHLDRDYRYKFVNQPYAEHYGRKPPEVIGKSAAEILGPAVFEQLLPFKARALCGEQVQFEIESTPPGLESRWIHVVYTPERGPAGEVIGFVSVHTDITPRKRAETEIERARDQALAASRAKDDFLAALSHELRTPLNPVLLVASDAAGNPRLPAPTRADFEMIRRHVELEARLIDDLLDLTRITRGKLALQMLPLNLLPVLLDAVATVQADADEKQIALHFDWQADSHRIVGDAVRLRQIFWNVLKNAVKFTPEGGRITVQTRCLVPDGRVAVEIIDTGIGLTAAEISQVFEAFSQGDHAGPGGSHQFGGLGLGLTIAHMLVELHSGAIRVASAGRNQGATFTIEFPGAAPSGEEKPPALPGGSLPPGWSGALRRKDGLRILLVEDHEPTRVALSHLLTRRHYHVFTAASVAEAQALVRRENIDLVVSDIGLPDGNGYALMSGLRDHYGLKGIALTGYGMDQDVSRARNSGFVAHLTKPVRVESLEQALFEAL
jgi:PAS domain S-box-containing protein